MEVVVSKMFKTYTLCINKLKFFIFSIFIKLKTNTHNWKLWASSRRFKKILFNQVVENKVCVKLILNRNLSLVSNKEEKKTNN